MRSLKRYIKVMSLIFSVVVIVCCIVFLCNPVEASAAALVDTVDVSVKVATAGDAGFKNTERSLTDIYNVLCLQVFLILFWEIWNIVRVVYRILTDWKHW